MDRKTAATQEQRKAYDDGYLVRSDLRDLAWYSIVGRHVVSNVDYVSGLATSGAPGQFMKPRK